VVVGPGLGQLRAYQDPLYAYCSLFDYTRTWPPRRRYELIDVTPCGAADSPAWNEVVTALGPMVGRDPTRDRVTGLPDDLVDAVLAPHVPPPEIPVAVPDVPPRRLDRFRRVLRRF
jgi:hypothetical protein